MQSQGQAKVIDRLLL